MKHLSFILLMCLFCASCDRDNDGSGTLVIKGVKDINTVAAMNYTNVPVLRNNQGNVHTMCTIDALFNVAEIWASQELVTEGLQDNFKWYKIGENDGLKSVDQYLFQSNSLPPGEYKSIKIIFRNEFVRIAAFLSNMNQHVEMASSLNESASGNGQMVICYFSKRGNHSLKPDGTFKCESKGEFIRGFKIVAGQVTTIYWMSGSPGMEPTDCTFKWDDVNGNSVWDAGTDDVGDFQCTVEGPMWSFSVDDGEANPFMPDAVTDIDGNKYDAVKIGNQIWMAENLRTTRLNDGTYLMTWEEYLASLIHDGQAPVDVAVRSYFNNDSNYLFKHGTLYSRMTVATDKLCPTGWHIPEKEEWDILLKFLGNNAGGKLKAIDNEAWAVPNTNATDEFDFKALPGGMLSTSNSFSEEGRYLDAGFRAYFWTKFVPNPVWIIPPITVLILSNQNGEATYQEILNESHASCRCIKNN